MWDNGEWIRAPYQEFNTPQNEIFNFLNNNRPNSQITALQELEPLNSWYDIASEVPSIDPNSIEGIEQLNNAEVATEHTIEQGFDTATQTYSEFETPYEVGTLDTVGIPQTTSMTYNWDLIWNPARSFATEDAATLEDLAQAAPSIQEVEATSEMIEGVAEGVSIGADVLTMGAGFVAQALTGIESAILDNRVSDFNFAAQQQYNNAMNTGHGIGYQNIAANNLMNALTASANYKGYYGIMTSTLGPFGGLVSLMTPMDTPVQQTSYEANTASGAQVDAQASDVVNTASA